MHALQPEHLLWLTRTTPPSFTWLAPVGQLLTHGASVQWLQRSDRISAARSGNSPRTSSTTQSRQKPSGTSFSALHERTHALQPTQSRVSAVIAYRFFGTLMSGPWRGGNRALDGHEVDAHPRAPRDRVHGHLRHERRVVQAAAFRELQARARVAVAVNDEDTVRPDPLRRLEPRRRGPGAVLIDEDDPFAVREAALLRDFRVQPHLVVARDLGEEPVVRRAAERVDGGPPEQEPELPRAGLRMPRVGRQRREASRLHLPGVELDLLRRRCESQDEPVLGRHGHGLAAQDALRLDLRDVVTAGGEARLDHRAGVVPREVRAEIHAVRELFRDPPARLALVERRHHGLAHREERLAPGCRRDVVPALEVRAFGKDDVGPADDLGRQDVDRDEEIQLLDRFEHVLALGEGLEEVRAVDDPALDRGGAELAGDRRVADAVREDLVREWVHDSVRVVLGRLRLLRVRGHRRLRDGHRRGDEEPAATAPASDEGVEDRHRAAPLRVVAVPRRVAAGMDERRGPRARDHARRLDDEFGADRRLREGPLGGLVRDVRLELHKAGRVGLDVLAVVEALFDDHVHPREEEGEVGPGLDREPVPRLARGGREARVDGDDRRAARDRRREVLHLRVVHILAEVRPEERDDARVRDVEHLRRADGCPVCELETDLARPAALPVGRRRDVRRAVGKQEVLEERAAESMREERDLLRSGLLLDLQELFGREVEGRLPGDFLESLVPALAVPAQERLLEAVRIVEETHAAGSARAEVAIGERVIGVSLDLRDAAVLHVREEAAFPEAELAERRDDPVAVRSGIVDDVGIEAPPLRGEAGACRGDRDARAPDLDELAPALGHLVLQTSGCSYVTPEYKKRAKRRSLRRSGKAGCRETSRFTLRRSVSAVASCFETARPIGQRRSSLASATRLLSAAFRPRKPVRVPPSNSGAGGARWQLSHVRALRPVVCGSTGERRRRAVFPPPAAEASMSRIIPGVAGTMRPSPRTPRSGGGRIVPATPG